MGKLATLPEFAIIRGFKGVVDFYLWKGIPCFRKWPRSPGKRRAPAVEAQWAAFAWAAANWDSLSPELQQAWKDTAAESGLSGRDLFVKAFITDYFRPGQWD